MRVSVVVCVGKGPAHAPLRMKWIKQGATRMDPPSEEVFTTPTPQLVPAANARNFPVRPLILL